MAGMNRAVGVLDDDAVDGKVEIDCFANGKIVAKGSLCVFFDLCHRIAAGDPLGVAMGFCHQALTDFGRRGDVE